MTISAADRRVDFKCRGATGIRARSRNEIKQP
jgi:hypothetical protein